MFARYKADSRRSSHHATSVILLALSISCYALPSHSAEPPNFVVILVDDAGFSDFGGYGGEASTPTIDWLASEGVPFSNYHTSPMCATSRAMLLTGLDNHRTGVATLPETITKDQRGSPGYELRLRPEVETIADLLKTRGYQTFMTGKWHLGSGDGDLPDSHGFDRSFVLDASGADNWEQKSFMPFYAEAPWYEDGEPATLPDDFYSSRFLVDKAMEYLDERDRQKPFFAYIAFQAIHFPLQAPREFIDRYKGVYSEGWDELRLQRFARVQALGLVPPDARPPEPHPSLRTWDSLTRDEKAHYEASMMVNAGMLEAMDHHIGRLMQHLERSGDLANTVLVITSDNGPEQGDPAMDNAIFRLWMRFNGYHTDRERLGARGYMGAIGPEWASAAAVPGSLFKAYASEGGTRVPLIVRGPGIAPQSFNNALSFVTDVAPTIAEMAGVEHRPMDGSSLMPILGGGAQRIHDPAEPIGMEMSSNSALFKAGYKLTRNSLPHGDGQWRLHDLGRDPAEAIDLSRRLPALKDELLEDYEQYAATYGVVPLPEGFNIVLQVEENTQQVMLKRYRVALMVIGVISLVLLALLFRWVIRGDSTRRECSSS